MTRIKRSKFPVAAFICVIAAITLLCLLFPGKITGAEGNGGSLEIFGVRYSDMSGFLVETNDYDASDASGAKTSCISVYDKNGKKLKIDSENISGAGGTLYFSINGTPSAARIVGGKIVFGKGFRVSSGGPVLASEIVFTSESTDGETGIVSFKAIQNEKPGQSVNDGSKNESVVGGSEETGKESVGGETKPNESSGQTEETSVESESPAKEQSEIEIESPDETGLKETGSYETGSDETGSGETEESDRQGDDSSEAEDPLSDEPSVIDIPYESDSGETSASDESVVKSDESAAISESDESSESSEIRESTESVESSDGNESAFESGKESGESNGESEKSNEESEKSNGESEVVRPPFNIGENRGESQGESGNESGGSGDDSTKTTVPIEEIKAEKDVYELKIGEKATVALTVLPENATEKYSVAFTSDGIAEYEEFTLKGIAAGETELVFKAENVEKRVKITVLSGKTEDGDKKEDIIYCEKISVPKSVKILLFGTEKIEVKTIPENVNFGKPGFASDNEEIATVDEDGNVTAIFRGKCNITVSFPTSDGGTIEEVVEVEVYDEIVDITRDTDIVLTIKDGKIIADDLEFTFTYKSGLVIKKTIQNATLSYRKDENGKFIGTISFVEDGEEYSFEIPVSPDFSGCDDGCGGGSDDGCGAAIVDNHGLLTGYIVVFVLSAAFIFINKKTR